MPKKGGKSEAALADFDSVPNPVEADMKKRIEKAEDEGIDKASAERAAREARGGSNTTERLSAEEIAENNSASKAKIFGVTLSMIVLGVALLLTLVWVGVSIGTSSLFVASDDSEEHISEVIDIDYDSITLSYGLGDKEPSKNKAGYLMQEFDSAENYAVIKSMSQLERLQNLYRAHYSSDLNFAESLGVNSRFFDSGSVIAITYESQDMVSVGISGVFRDERYNISSSIKVDPVLTEQANDGLRGNLVLIKIENIQPKKVNVHISGAKKEAE